LLWLLVLEEVDLCFQTSDGLVFGNNPVFKVSESLVEGKVVLLDVEEFALKTLSEVELVVPSAIGLVELFLEGMDFLLEHFVHFSHVVCAFLLELPDLFTHTSVND